jgi:hypothetical protein
MAQPEFDDLTPPDHLPSLETRKLPGSMPQNKIRHVPPLSMSCAYLYRDKPSKDLPLSVPLVEPLAFCSPWETHRERHTHTQSSVRCSRSHTKTHTHSSLTITHTGPDEGLAFTYIIDMTKQQQTKQALRILPLLALLWLHMHACILLPAAAFLRHSNKTCHNPPPQPSITILETPRSCTNGGPFFADCFD